MLNTFEYKIALPRIRKHRKNGNQVIYNNVRNGRILKFWSAELFKANTLSYSDQYSLVMAQWHHLREGE